MRYILQRRGFLLVLYLAVAVSLAAQGGLGKGRLTGVVLDDEGRPVPSAKIVLRFLGKRDFSITGSDAVIRKTDSGMIETASNEDGKWNRNLIMGGWWNITASCDGYHSADWNYFIRELSQNRKIILRLAKISGSE